MAALASTPEQPTRATAAWGAINNGGFLLGAGVGGAVIAALGAGWAAAIAAGLLGSAGLLSLRLPASKATALDESDDLEAGGFAEALAGLRAVARSPMLRSPRRHHCRPRAGAASAGASPLAGFLILAATGLGLDPDWRRGRDRDKNQEARPAPPRSGPRAGGVAGTTPTKVGARDILGVLWLVRARGVERVEHDVLVVSVDRLIHVLGVAAVMRKGSPSKD